MFGLSPEMLLELMRDQDQRKRESQGTHDMEWMEGVVDSFSGGGSPDDRSAAAEAFRAEMMRRQAERDAAGEPDYDIELRRRWLSGGVQEPLVSPRRPPADGRPQGWPSTYPPGYEGRSVDSVPPEVRSQMEADMEFARTYEPRAQPGDVVFSEEEWEDLREYGYEPTRSPLVLRERHPNGTVTYVHAAAVRSDPRFQWKGYGMNGPQGERDDKSDPFWREGRRDW